MISRLGNIELKQPVQGIPVASSVLANIPLSWSEDNKIALTTTNGVYIFSLCFSPDGYQPGLSFKRFYLSPPEYPNPYILSGSELQSLVNSIKNVDEAQKIMLDATLTAAHRAGIEISSKSSNPNASGNAQGMDFNHSSYAKAVWSYKGATERDECVLCLVTYDHQIQIVGQFRNQWRTLYHISSLWANYITDEGKDILKDYQSSIGTEKYHHFIAKTRLEGVAGILWTRPLISSGDCFSVLMIATTSSHLVLVKIPKIKSDASEEPCILKCFSLDQSLGKISFIEWMSICKNGGFVCVGTIEGYIEIYYLSLNTKYELKKLFKFENSLLGMHVNHLQLKCVDEKKKQFILFVGKHNIFLAYLLVASSSKVEVLNWTHYMSGCYQISGIKVIEPSLVYVSTKDGEMKKVEISYDFGTKAITFSKRDTLFSSKGKVFYCGFCFSPNNTFFAILECVSVPYDHLQLREPTVINIFQGDSFNCLLEHVLQNDNNTLCEQIDIFESIRLLTHKGGVIFPSVTAEDVSTLSNCLKKVYTWLMTIELSLLSQNCQAGEIIKEMENIKNALEESLLADYIEEVFSFYTKESFPDDNQHRLSLHLMCTFFQQSKRHHPLLKMLKSQLNEKCDGIETCSRCSIPVEFNSIKKAQCSNGHEVHRCQRTLLQISSISMCSCCNLYYHSEASNWYGEIATTCLICTKKLEPEIRRKILKPTKIM